MPSTVTSRAQGMEDAKKYLQTITQTGVDITTLVEPGDKIHVIHGGNKDDQSVFQCASHLQSLWSAGLIWIRERSHLVDVSRHIARLDRIGNIIVAVSAEVVASSPDDFNFVSLQKHVTILLSLPANCVAGKPYSSKSGIVAVVLPSCRLEPSESQRACTVYRYPGSLTTVETFLDVLPHGFGLAWKVGRSASPASVTFNHKASSNQTQDWIEKTFWWSANALLIPVLKEIPLVPFRLVGSNAAVFRSDPDEPAVRVLPQTFQFKVQATQEEIITLRSGETGSAFFDFLIVDVDGVVVPLQISLGHCDFVAADGPHVVLRYDYATAPKMAPAKYVRPTPISARLPVL